MASPFVVELPVKLAEGALARLRGKCGGQGGQVFPERSDFCLIICRGPFEEAELFDHNDRT